MIVSEAFFIPTESLASHPVRTHPQAAGNRAVSDTSRFRQKEKRMPSRNVRVSGLSVRAVSRPVRVK